MKTTQAYVLHVWGAVAISVAMSFVAGLPLPSKAQTSARKDDPPVIILVRHGDKAAKPADDPPLTAAGQKRAEDLAATLRNAGVTAIITTQVRRTRETAQPLAAALGLTPQIIKVGERALVPNPIAGMQFPPEVVNERAAYVKTLVTTVRNMRGVVLVVGHDWSVPGLIAALGGPQFDNICSSVYDNLFGAATPDADCK